MALTLDGRRQLGTVPLYLGSLELSDHEGCLITRGFHAHGLGGVAGYYKMRHGTTPTAHKEAGHSILWADAADKLYFEKVDGTDIEVPLTAGANINQTTGWIEGGQGSINAGDNTKLDITPGSVLIVTGTNTPIGKVISWGQQTALDPRLTTRSKWVGVKDDGAGNAEFVFDIDFDSIERRTNAILFRIWDSGGSGPQITNVGGYERPAWGLLTAFQDFILEYGSWNISGNVYSANGVNLLLDKSAGKSFRYHAEDTIGLENAHSDASQSPRTSYAYHLQGSPTTTSESDIEPDYYDNGGVKATVTPNDWTVQEVWFFPVSGTCHVLYGQVVYGSKAEAIEGITTETKARNEGILSGAILRAYLVIEKGCTDLTDSATAEIREASVGIGGGGGSSAAWSKTGTNISPTTAGDNLLLNTGETVSIADMITGSIPFFGASGLLSQDNANLFWDDVNKRLGLGQTTARSALHIKANTPGTVGSHPAGQIIIQNPTDSVLSNAAITGYESDAGGNPGQQLWYLGSSSSSNSDISFLNRRSANLHLGTNGIARMTVDSGGNLGLGTTDVEAWNTGFRALEIGTGSAVWGSTTAITRLWLTDNFYYDSVGWKYKTTGEGIGAQFYDGTFTIKTAPSGTIDTAATLTDRLTLSNIGQLDVQGIYDETDASAANVFVASDGSLRRSTSSHKIKKDIVENVNPDWALQFKPVTFKAKADDSEHIGFISEDMREVDPRFTSDGDLPGLEMYAIVATLTALVQNQQKQIDGLEERIQVLESIVEDF